MPTVDQVLIVRDDGNGGCAEPQGHGGSIDFSLADRLSVKREGAVGRGAGPTVVAGGQAPPSPRGGGAVGMNSRAIRIDGARKDPT